MARRRLVQSFQDGFGLVLRNATRHRRARNEPLARPHKRPNCGRAERGAIHVVAAHRVSHVIHVVCRRHWPAALRLIATQRLSYFMDKIKVARAATSQ